MITVKIDSVACDLRREDAEPVLGKFYDFDALADPESARTGRSVALRLPSTPPLPCWWRERWFELVI